MSTTGVRPGDAFLLGYLPQLVGAHLAWLGVLETVRPGATGPLAALVAEELDILPRRGAEIVSCIWHIESILGDRLRVEPPSPPRTRDEQAAWTEAATLPLVSRWPDRADPVRAAFDLGGRVGAVESDLDVARKIARLLEVEPAHPYLGARSGELARALVAMAADIEDDDSGAVESATVRAEIAVLARGLRGAADVAARMPDGDREVAVALSDFHREVAGAARGLEAATWGTPRDAVRDWRAKNISGLELGYRIAEHRRWSVPVRRLDDGQSEPRVFVFDRRVLLAFSDADTVRARPRFLHGDEPEDNLLLTVPGWTMFSWLPDPAVDLIVLDASDDPEDGATINFPGAMHPGLKQAGTEVKADLAATDWSHVDVETLRAHRYWILLDGDTVKNLVAKDGYGRARVGVYTAEACLDAHLERASPEQRSEYAAIQRVVLPGEALFRSLLQLDIEGLVVNPYGPGKTRAFDRKMLEFLAGGGL